MPAAHGSSPCAASSSRVDDLCSCRRPRCFPSCLGADSLVPSRGCHGEDPREPCSDREWTPRLQGTSEGIYPRRRDGPPAPGGPERQGQASLLRPGSVCRTRTTPPERRRWRGCSARRRAEPPAPSTSRFPLACSGGEAGSPSGPVSRRASSARLFRVLWKGDGGCWLLLSPTTGAASGLSDRPSALRSSAVGAPLPALRLLEKGLGRDN